jgi:hypothetical protein
VLGAAMPGSHCINAFAIALASLAHAQRGNLGRGLGQGQRVRAICSLTGDFRDRASAQALGGATIDKRARGVESDTDVAMQIESALKTPLYSAQRARLSVSMFARA